MRVWNVGIVGGGPGGLMTAYTLQKLANRPLRITLFEAAERLGGKILSPNFQASSVRYEAGAAEFYDYSHFDEDPLKELVAELGLPIRAMGGPAVILNQQVLANLDDIHAQLGPDACRALVAFDQIAKDRCTPQEFYHSDHPEGSSAAPEYCCFDAFLGDHAPPAARNYVEKMIHSDLATEPKRTSMAYGLHNYLMNDPAYMQLYGIEGGNERLPRELAARLEATVLLEHRVKEIAGTGVERIRIASSNGAGERSDEFDFVVVALPHGDLRRLSFSGERLAEAVRNHCDRYDFPAHYLRITILFRTPFWRQTISDSYWMLDQFDGCCLYDESSREPEAPHGVLGWLLGGEAAERMSALPDEELIAAALDSLPPFLAAGREEFVEGRIHRWLGAVNGMPGGQAPPNLDRRHQPEPLEHSRLFLVGDYMFDSTLNGVLDSAEYVASWIASQIADAA